MNLRRDKLKIADTEKVKEMIVNLLTIIFVLLSLNLLSGNLGIYNKNLDRILVIYLLFAVVIFNTNIRRFITKLRESNSHFPIKYVIISIVIIAGSFLLLFTSSIRELWLLHLPIFLIGLDFFIQAHGGFKPVFFVLSIISLVYLLFFLLTHNIPQLYIIVQNISLVISRYIGGIVTPFYPLSASTSGFWIFLTFLLFTVVSYVFSEEKLQKKNIRLLLVGLSGLLISWMIYILIQNTLYFESELDRINALYLMFIVSLIPLIIFIILHKQTGRHVWYFPHVTTKTIQRRISIKIALLIGILLFFSGFFIQFLPAMASSQEKSKIGIYLPGINVGALDVPEYGIYGRYASGFFGFLPQYLDSYQYSVDLINTNLTKDVLDRCDVIVIINLAKSFDNETLFLIWNFVEQGGSLLVMTDHTDLGSIMAPFNILLEPVGIHVRFDSAIPIKEHWLSSYSLLHHQITEGLDLDYNIEISVGASLTVDITKSAFPLVIGKGGFSDQGDYQNNSNLGDYALNPGEQFGDVILAAGAYYGKGRVIAFGDTSSFQNLALISSHRFISNIFSWLTTENTMIFSFTYVAVALVCFGGASVLFIFFRQSQSIIFPLILAAALISATALNSTTQKEQTMVGPMVFIDISHNERFNRNFYKDDSVTGLALNLMRTNYTEGKRFLPIIVDTFSEEKLLQCKILVLIAPMKPFNRQEIDLIERFMILGGLVILSVGYEDKDAISSLLERLNLDVLPIPLGPVPYVEDNITAYINKPRFVDSWPISVQKVDNTTRVFYSMIYKNNIYDLVVFKKVGTGGLLIIGDNQYLLDKNLEGFNDFWPGNIAFFKSMIEEMKKEGTPK